MNQNIDTLTQDEKDAIEALMDMQGCLAMEVRLDNVIHNLILGGAEDVTSHHPGHADDYLKHLGESGWAIVMKNNLPIGDKAKGFKLLKKWINASN